LGANKASGKDDKNSGKEYHATVTPAENFDALKDADTLHDANGKISILFQCNCSFLFFRFQNKLCLEI
jgi:hypothetical protein